MNYRLVIWTFILGAPLLTPTTTNAQQELPQPIYRSLHHHRKTGK